LPSSASWARTATGLAAALLTCGPAAAIGSAVLGTVGGPQPAGAAPAVPAEQVEHVDPQTATAAEVAADLARLDADAAAAGIGLCGRSGFRSYAEQAELRRQNCGSSDYALYVAPPSTCSPPTARPGMSNHEDGLAIDFDCADGQRMTHASPCYQWLAANASRYGLYNLPSEPWHWSVTGR
jgi:LAS superfamily LD-carboxypeptidase LdcB